MANLNREFANQPKPDDPLEADGPKVALMTFSKIYDGIASWPRRRKAAFELLRKLLRGAAQVPLEAMFQMIDGDPNLSRNRVVEES